VNLKGLQEKAMEGCQNKDIESGCFHALVKGAVSGGNKGVVGEMGVGRSL
jgi:hypothetical protein